MPKPELFGFKEGKHSFHHCVPFMMNALIATRFIVEIINTEHMIIHLNLKILKWELHNTAFRIDLDKGLKCNEKKRKEMK